MEEYTLRPLLKGIFTASRIEEANIPEKDFDFDIIDRCLAPIAPWEIYFPKESL